jgi:TonB family protein
MNTTMNIFTSTLVLGLTTSSGMAGVNQTMNQALDRGQDSPIAYLYQTSTAEEEGTGLSNETEKTSLVLHSVTPRYPAKAQRESIEGWVELVILVDEQGLVADVDVVKANPPRIFEKAAIESVNQWRFQPKMVAGQAVPYEYRQTIDFELINYMLVDGEIVAEQ